MSPWIGNLPGSGVLPLFSTSLPRHLGPVRGSCLCGLASDGPEHWGRLLSPSESLVKVCSRVAGRFQVQPEGKSPCANDFLVSACIILATVPWPKESHDQSQRPCGREGTTESCEIRELVDLWLFVPCINNWQKKLTASSQRIDHLWKLFICTSD